MRKLGLLLLFAIAISCVKVKGQVSDWESPGKALELGNKYYYGNGEPKDYSKAFYWYQKAANQNNITAQAMLAFMYYNAQGTAKDIDASIYWNKKAADGGSSYAWGQLGYIYEEQQNYPNALQCFKKAAESPSDKETRRYAQYCIGRMYDLGLGVSEDDSEAYRWYKLSAAAGYDYAINRLKVLEEDNPFPNENLVNAGDYYRFYEENVAKKNFDAAFKAIVKCDKMVGHSPLSSTIIGVMRLLGAGTPKDTTRAFIDGFSVVAYCIDLKSETERAKTVKMYEGMASSDAVNLKAAIEGVKESWVQQDAQYGHLMLRDAEQTVLTNFAFRWMACYSMLGVDRAISTGDFEEKLANADAVIEDVNEGLALSDDAYLKYLLGKIWYEGLAGMKDRQKGIALFEESASKGSISALTYIGDIMKKKGDIIKARDYWQKAVEQEVKPLILPTKKNVSYFSSPNIDLYDVRIMREKAIQNLKN